jgi:hypothetical protein
MMDNRDNTFREVQKFSQPWIWIGILLMGLLSAGLFGFGIYRQVYQGVAFGNNPMGNTGLIVSFFMVLALFSLLVLLFAFARLSTVIDRKGITYRFVPFHFGYQQIEWKNITSWEVVTYNPVRDYGGWGIKYGKGGSAFNVSGNKGLKIGLKNGKTMLFGTNRADDLTNFLRDLPLDSQLEK